MIGRRQIDAMEREQEKARQKLLEVSKNRDKRTNSPTGPFFCGNQIMFTLFGFPTPSIVVSI